MVLHVLYLEKENGNVPYHLPEKRVVPIEKQMNGIFSLALVIVDKRYRNFRTFRSKREKGNTSKGITFFPKTFHRDEPFHLNSLRNYRKFHSNGKRSFCFLPPTLRRWRHVKTSNWIRGYLHETGTNSDWLEFVSASIHFFFCVTWDRPDNELRPVWFRLGCWVPFLESPETFLGIFGCQNSFCISRTERI